MSAPRMGVCRFCGCTEDDPCKLPGNETCGWVTRLRTVCSNYRCLARWEAESRRLARERTNEVRGFRQRYWKSVREKREQAKLAKAMASKKGLRKGKGRAA